MPDILNPVSVNTIPHCELIDIHAMAIPEIAEAGFVLTEALLHNPIQVAVYQNHLEQYRTSIEQKFIQILEHSFGQVFVAKMRSQIVGVYRHKICPTKSQSLFASLHQPLDLNRIENREQLWYHTWQTHDPLAQHSHLGPIGVHPNCQHLGIGTQLLKHYCNLLDHRQLAGYLEADKQKNAVFYQQFGFEIRTQQTILGVENFFMWREFKHKKAAPYL